MSETRPIELARDHVTQALEKLQDLMRNAPGPYPDPECPIHAWQEAHEHLVAAQFLLEI